MKLRIDLDLAADADAEVVEAALRRLALGAGLLGRSHVEFPLVREGEIVGHLVVREQVDAGI